MRIIAIVQARMGSTRLPGKVLLPLHKKTVLGHVISRLQHCNHLSNICIATTLDSIDNVIVAEAKQYGAEVFRGSALDVLDRYYQAAKCFNADIVVRVTSDCPLIDPNLLSIMLDKYINESKYRAIDYFSNTIKRTYPRGMDVEIFNFQALEKAAIDAQEPYQREHVTPYIYFNPDKFFLEHHCQNKDDSRFRVTLDVEDDYRAFKALTDFFQDKIETVRYQEIVEFLERHPEIVNINAHVIQKSLI